MINECDVDFSVFNEISRKDPYKLNVVMFKASWCGPCKVIYPSIVELSNEYPSVNFYKIEIDDDKELIQSYLSFFKPSKIPSFYFYKKTMIVDSIIGTDINKISDLIEKHL